MPFSRCSTGSAGSTRRSTSCATCASTTIDNPRCSLVERDTGDEVVVVTCVLNPIGPQGATLHLDLAALGFGPEERVLGPRPDHRRGPGRGARHNYIRHRPHVHLCSMPSFSRGCHGPRPNTPADPGTPKAGKRAGDRSAGGQLPPAPAGPPKRPVDTGEIDRLVDGASASPHAILGAHPYERRRDDPRPAAAGQGGIVVTPVGAALDARTSDSRGVRVVVLPGDTIPDYRSRWTTARA